MNSSGYTHLSFDKVPKYMGEKIFFFNRQCWEKQMSIDRGMSSTEKKKKKTTPERGKEFNR